MVLELSKCASLREPLALNEGIHELIKLLHRHKDDGEGKDAVRLATEAVLEVHWRENPDVALDMAEALMFKPLVECLGEGEGAGRGGNESEGASEYKGIHECVGVMRRRESGSSRWSSALVVMRA